MVVASNARNPRYAIRKEVIMVEIVGDDRYLPGTYPRSKPMADEVVGHYFRAWEKKRSTVEGTESSADQPDELPPCIAFSRKFGVGALEIADLTAQRLGYRVADKELIEQIASQANITEEAIAYFDERFPGYTDRIYKYLFGEKAFTDSDYSRHLFNAVHAIADLESTVFVGRGGHLILPRDRVLAVYCVRSDDYRAKRIAETMKISQEEAGKRLATMDKERSAFFKKVFGKKSGVSHEFDLTINLDYFNKPEDVAELIALAFNKKFDR